ncbi:hypothetical protein DRE_06499 [Drechslerella stenobrocha 248]|uniref:Uncharacterized protein n=1 Tax=Drechslerella stenobrocha 248 TaxID=1043628 RepID=W7HL64_9PEZI|nr:hypothetical protein DRE_06499 [Drechslerella stenobrocha 248]
MSSSNDKNGQKRAETPPAHSPRKSEPTTPNKTENGSSSKASSSSYQKEPEREPYNGPAPSSAMMPWEQEVFLDMVFGRHPPSPDYKTQYPFRGKENKEKDK